MDVNLNTTFEPAPAPTQYAPASAPANTPAPVSAPPQYTPAVETQTTNNKPNGNAATESVLQTHRQAVEELDKAIGEINKSIAPFSRQMNISVHEKLNRIMIKVMDTEKNEIIREIPPKKVLDAFAASLELAGILIDKKS